MTQENINTILGGMGGIAVGVILLVLVNHFVDDPYGRDSWKMVAFFTTVIALCVGFLVWSWFAWPQAWR